MLNPVVPNVDIQPNEDLRKILVDAYVYRDLKENISNRTFQLEKMIKNNIINTNDPRFHFLFKARQSSYEFYNMLTLNELQYLGF